MQDVGTRQSRTGYQSAGQSEPSYQTSLAWTARS